MAQKRKLFERIQNNPKNVRPNDLRTVLEWAGFVHLRTSGSHYIFKHSNCEDILTVPWKVPLKAVYVKQALELIKNCADVEALQ